MKWSILAAHLVFAAAGVVSAFAVGSKAAERLHAARPKWIILKTSCWTALPWAYNDVHAPRSIVSDFASEQSSLMNFVWCNEYSGAHDPIFVLMGNGAYLEGQLFWIERAAALPDVEGIVFALGPGSTGNFLISEQTLGAIPVLERIRWEYPEASAAVDVFLKCLYASEGYRRALAEEGNDFRDRIDPDQGLLLRRGLGSKIAVLVDEFTGFASRIRENVAERLLRLPTSDRSEAPIHRRSPKSGRVVELLDGCAARYLDPANKKPLQRLTKKDFWGASGGEAAWNAWANIVAKVCKARGIKLIVYIPPHLHVTPEQYRTHLKPDYIDRVRSTFRPYDNVYVIDYAEGRPLNLADTVWNSPGIDRNSGLVPNVIGRLKTSRFLIKTLVEAGLLTDRGGVPRYLGSAWPEERSLPQTSPVLDYLSESDMARVEDFVLTEEARVRSSRASDTPSAGGLQPQPPSALNPLSEPD